MTTAQIRLTINWQAVVMSALLALVSVRSGSAEQQILKLATTTSVDHSGLLAYLLPGFEKKYGIKVHVIAVGTGKALKHGENGDVDALIVHAPPAEMKFIEAGFGVDRNKIMENDFIILGPKNDPASLKKSRNLKAALNGLSTSGASFISRGDDSGTHKKERLLWSKAGLQPKGDWYAEVGQGMGPTLLIASQKQGYTLSDMGTWLSMKKRLNLDVAFASDPLLLNVYSVMTINPKRHQHVRHELASKLSRWLVSEEAQSLIGAYKVEGEALFRPLRQSVGQ